MRSSDWQIRDTERLITGNRALLGEKHLLVAMTRIRNEALIWEQDIDARKLAEGRHRGLLLDMARAELPHDWMLCFDPDERVTGDLRGFVQGPGVEDCDSVKVQLFDAYMTQEDNAPYRPELPLLDFRRF